MGGDRTLRRVGCAFDAIPVTWQQDGLVRPLRAHVSHSVSLQRAVGISYGRDVHRHVIAVYGTLRRGGQNHHLLNGAEFLGGGLVRGRIHAVRAAVRRPYAYPLLLPDDTESVVVELYGITDPVMLQALYFLERYNPADETASEYVRRTVTVFAYDRTTPVRVADVYFYNGSPTAIGELIAGGDWAHAGNSAAYPDG